MIVTVTHRKLEVVVFASPIKVGRKHLLPIASRMICQAIRA